MSVGDHQRMRFDRLSMSGPSYEFHQNSISLSLSKAACDTSPRD